MTNAPKDADARRKIAPVICYPVDTLPAPPLRAYQAADTLDWYGIDAFGGSVHDVIGTRCDPYTGHLLNGTQYHHCCHSNLTRALADATGLSRAEAEPHVHDVLNVWKLPPINGYDRSHG